MFFDDSELTVSIYISPETLLYGKTSHPFNIYIQSSILFQILISSFTLKRAGCLVFVQLDVHSYSSGEQLAEWVPYVLSARCAAEQNMEATFDDGLLYFCVTQDVNDGSELLIWYSDQLAQLLGVPELDDECQTGKLLSIPK